MSWEIVKLVSSRKHGGAVRRSLMLTLAHYARNDEHVVYASVPSISKHSEIDTRTVQRNLKGLVEAGILEDCGEYEHKFGKTRKYKLNLAAIRALEALDKPAELAETPRHSATPVAAPPPAECVIPPGALTPPAQDHPRATPRHSATQTSITSIGEVGLDAGAREPNWRELGDKVRKWANGSVNQAVANDPGVIIRLLKPHGGIPCTEQDVEFGITKAAASLHARGEVVSTFAYFEKAILRERDKRLTPLPEPELINERTGQGQHSDRAGNASGYRGARSGGQHRSGSLALGLALLQSGSEAEDDVSYRPEDGRISGVA